MNYLLTGEETERLTFRMLEQSDYDEWMNLFVGTDVARFLGMAHLHTPKEQCDLWFEKSFGRYRDNKGGMNVLIEKATGKFVGQCGLLLQHIDESTIMEIGYSLLPQHWGKGYALEAARKCRDHAFSNNYTNELYSIIHPENRSSEKVAENNGMRRYKFLPDYQGMPVNMYRVTKGEWDKLGSNTATNKTKVK